MELVIFVLLGAGAYVGWNIGANDTANCIGTTVGCGLISFRKAAILVAVFAIIGALLQGQHVMKTISKGIVNLNIFSPILLLFIGGISIAVGAITFGKKVADTVGKGITPLDIPGAFVAQVSSAFGMHLFSLFGIPVSTSSAIVGAVVGVGLVKGARAISKKTIATILVGWVLTPTMAGSFSFWLYKVLKLIWN